MNRKIILTADGSHSLYVEKLDEIYHSKNGAIAESEHVFIRAGLQHLEVKTDPISILEIGFGTGLNAFCTAIECRRSTTRVEYTALEPFPVDTEIINQLNYPICMASGNELFWKLIHKGKWNTWLDIHTGFKLMKYEHPVETYSLPADQFNLVYFDAFAPDVQPELWTKDIFRKLFIAMQPEGVLVTYSARGTVRRNLQSAGFMVERIPGPAGKREMLRATKLVSA